MSALETPASEAMSSIDALWYPRAEKTVLAASRMAARRASAVRRLRVGAGRLVIRREV